MFTDYSKVPVTGDRQRVNARDVDLEGETATRSFRTRGIPDPD